MGGGNLVNPSIVTTEGTSECHLLSHFDRFAASARRCRQIKLAVLAILPNLWQIDRKRTFVGLLLQGYTHSTPKIALFL